MTIPSSSPLFQPISEGDTIKWRDQEIKLPPNCLNELNAENIAYYGPEVEQKELELEVDVNDDVEMACYLSRRMYWKIRDILVAAHSGYVNINCIRNFHRFKSKK